MDDSGPSGPDWVKRNPRQASKRGLYAAALSSDNKFLAVGGGDRKVHVFDAISGRRVPEPRGGSRLGPHGVTFGRSPHTPPHPLHTPYILSHWCGLSHLVHTLSTPVHTLSTPRPHRCLCAVLPGPPRRRDGSGLQGGDAPAVQRVVRPDRQDVEHRRQGLHGLAVWAPGLCMCGRGVGERVMLSCSKRTRMNGRRPFAR